jgi:hypothetical protein
MTVTTINYYMLTVVLCVIIMILITIGAVYGITSNSSDFEEIAKKANDRVFDLSEEKTRLLLELNETLHDRHLYKKAYKEYKELYEKEYRSKSGVFYDKNNDTIVVLKDLKRIGDL